VLVDRLRDTDSLVLIRERKKIDVGLLPRLFDMFTGSIAEETGHRGGWRPAWRR